MNRATSSIANGSIANGSIASEPISTHSDFSSIAVVKQNPACHAGSGDLHKRLHRHKNTLSSLENWEFSHYREKGWLGWLVKFILWLFPLSRARLEKLDKLEMEFHKHNLMKASLIEASLMEASLTEIELKKNAADIVEIKSSTHDTLSPCSLPMKAAIEPQKTPFLLPSKGLIPLSEIVEAPLKNPLIADLKPLLNAATQSDPPPIDSLPLQSDKGTLIADKQPLESSYHLDKPIATSPLQEDALPSIQNTIQEAIQEATDLIAAVNLQTPSSVPLSNLGSKALPPKTQFEIDKESLLTALQIDGWALQEASFELQADREVVLAAVAKVGYVLKYAAVELQADREIVLTAVMNNGYALQFASDGNKSNRHTVMTAVQKSGYALQFAAAPLQSDKEIVLEAVAKRGTALQFASTDLIDNREVVLTAVMQNGKALKYASKAYQCNLFIVQTAVSQNGVALKYAAPSMQANREIVLSAIKQNGKALQYASSELQADKELIQIAALYR